MGNGTAHSLPPDLQRMAKRLEAELAKNPPKLLGVRITPLGGLGAHLLYTNTRNEAHDKDRTVSGTVRLDGSKVRITHEDIDVKKSVAPGTPDPSKPSTRNIAVTRIESPMLQLDTKTGKLSGLLRLSLDDGQYPRGLVDPTVLQLHVSSETPNLTIDALRNPKVEISTKYGPVHADFKLKLRYDAAELARAGLSDALSGGGPSELLKKLSGPGFDLSGLVQFAVIKKIPVLGHILRTKIEASSPSMVRLRQPLTAAPAPYEFKYNLFGIVPVPAGAIFETKSLGYGMTGEKWSSESGRKYSVAGIAVPSPTKLSEVSLYLYVNYYRVWRVADGWELSVDLSFSPSKVVGGGEKTKKDLQQQWKEASDRSWLDPSGKFVHAEEKPMLFGEAKLKYTF